MLKSHLLARAVIQDAGHVLVAQARGFTNTFLPGGHLEPGEGMQAALTRELREELGAEVRVGAFLGVIEQTFTDHAGQEHEGINFLFEVSGEALRADRRVPSREAYLTFDWVPLGDLARRDLRPSPLCTLLRERPAGAWFASVKD